MENVAIGGTFRFYISVYYYKRWQMHLSFTSGMLSVCRGGVDISDVNRADTD